LSNITTEKILPSAFACTWSVSGHEESSRKFYLSSPEDIVLRKLQWYHKGGGVSEQQRKDVLGVLKIQGDKLDLEYLKYWASRLNLSDLLNRSFDDAGMTESA
jgi:hypothetical protein